MPPRQTRVEEAVRFLVNEGLDEFEVRMGSIPESSLDYLAAAVEHQLPSERPVRALHVGNFVGVSLCYVSWLVTERHPESVVISIDPNIPHRGIEDPQSHALALLEHFQLLGSNLIIAGYTLERSDEATTVADHLRGIACENVLSSLHQLSGATFDLVLIDGKHEETHLAREIAGVRRLVADNGIVVFDDITDWAGVAEVFRETSQDESWVELGQDGRIGILQRRAIGQAV
jgi:predicted O-methyltransferase YrrM